MPTKVLQKPKLNKLQLKSLTETYQKNRKDKKKIEPEWVNNGYFTKQIQKL